jgi:hypothetical protein
MRARLWVLPWNTPPGRCSPETTQSSCIWHDATDGCDPELVAIAAVVGVEHTGREALVTLEIAAPPVIAPGGGRR